MATSRQFQERLRRAVREAVQKCLAEGDLPEAQEGEACFTTIEALALAAGDAVSLEVFEQQLAESGMGPPHCPHCGFEGQRIKQRERTLQTRRGLKVPLFEQECYCPGCRRAFFPRSQALGLDVDYDYSPTALKKVVYAGTQATSFPQGSRDLNELAELDVTAERVRRATERIGKERVAERDAQAAAYGALPIPAQRSVPADLPTPAVACVQMDGGRLQIFDRAEPQRNEEDTFWREMKVGCLWSMTSEVSAEDPCPRLPASFVDPERMQRMVREIKGFSGPEASAEDEAEEPRIDERLGRPEPLARSVVATRHEVETFGKLLASEAYQRRFPDAPRKAFVADGSEANWGVWRRHFSDYVPILDFIHALTYVYAAAMAGRALKEGWHAYRQWAQWTWSGQVDRVIADLELRQQELGEPTEETSKTAPSAIVAMSLGYLRNQRSRMDYPEYRKQGLPMTSTYVESTVKQINRRMKGTEKFWSRGVEPMLTLVADHLSDTPTLARFWRNRTRRQTGSRCVNQAA